VIIDLLLSKEGLRAERVDLSLSGMRLARGATGFEPQVAELVTGAIRLRFADLTAALARPEIVDQLRTGVAGVARPEITLSNGDDGGIRIGGSVEILGRRFPITASCDLRIEKNRVVVSATKIRGLPLIGSIPVQLLDLSLPLTLPSGLRFTDVTTETGCIVVHFEGHDLPLSTLMA